jgi:excisionase family DNA binding protein
MPAYATHGPQLEALPLSFDLQHRVVGEGDGILEGLIAQLADRVTAAVLARLEVPVESDAEWLDSRHAADYLGLHRDTLRKLAAERAIPSEQEGPGCKLYFRRSDLDAWRSGGGRPRHLVAVADRTA